MLRLVRLLVLAPVLFAFSHGWAAAQQPRDPAQAAQLAAFAASIREVQASGIIPIIDVEHHWGGKLDVADLVAKMDRHGVALTWLGQNEKNGSSHVFPDFERFPGRIVPTTIHGDGPRWHGNDATLMQELAADVATGKYFAMGEFEGRHYVSSTNSRDVHKPVDSPDFEAVFRLSQESGLPFLIHHEAEDALLPELERMLDKYPGAKAVWCHCGRNRNRMTWTVVPTPQGMRALIGRHPNLYFDLNQAKPGSRHSGTNEIDPVLYDVGEKKKGGMSEPDAKLLPEWRKLLEDHPDRFLFGSDVNTGRWDNYGQVVGNFRKIILAALPRDVAERIAWKNAWKMMAGEEWRD